MVAKRANGSIAYPKVVVEVYDPAEGKFFKVKDGKELLGWKEEPEGKTWEEYDLRDVNGKKVRLEHRITNRPFRMALAKRYSNEILRKKWSLNGETFVIDRKGHVQDSQHRMVGLILAEQERLRDPQYWATYW
jgi:hypothetical protein